MSLKILYVEDNVLNMRLVKRILQDMGFMMIEAMDGLSGLLIAEQTRPDLILMDINLPDMDGLEVTRRLKTDPVLSAIPVIALTANALHGDRDRCLAAGCSGYLAKPVSRQELKDAIYQFSGKGLQPAPVTGYTGLLRSL